MKFKHLLLMLGLCAFAITSNAQRGKDGAGVIAAAATVVNNFTILTADATAGATSITVADNSMNVFFPGNLAAGDLIFIYQAQGADILGVPNGNLGSPNGPTWGEITAYNNCGNYEFAEVVGVTGTTGIDLSCPLQYSYTAAGRVQVVRVPRYSTLVVNAGASITSPIWNSAAGGLVVLECDGDMTINGTIGMNAGGFRGGSLVGDNITGSTPDWAVNVAFLDAGAEKGESIAGYQGDYDTNNGGRLSRACPANGGGGGNGHNAGGGGGANAAPPGLTWTGFGQVDPTYNVSWALEAGWLPNHNRAGGGKGGYSFSSTNADATVTGPSNAAWGGDWRRPYGGQGGRVLDYTTGKIFMGGGGGAGDQNNGDGGEGGRGGGIIFLRGYANVNGSGLLTANGQPGFNTDPSNPPFGGMAGHDAAGGGGAGGTIIVNVDGTVSGVTINANGGKGGDQLTAAGTFGSVDEAEGPGGGGGGGYIAVSNGAPARNTAGGVNGTTDSPHLTEFPPNGASSGNLGYATASIDNFYPTATDVTICSGTSTTLTAAIVGTAPVGTVIGWYDQEVGGTLLGTGTTYNTPVLVATTTYYVGTCPGHYRIPVTVTISPPMVVDETNMVIVDETCAGNDGSITGIQISGGTAPYSYDWNSGAYTTLDITGLTGGSYTLTITDAAGCTATSGPHVVGTGGGPVVDLNNMVIVNTTCGNSNGSITGITHSGGALPITYSWNGGAYTTLDITNIPAGSYTLDVIDNLGCTTTVGPFNVTDTPGPTIDVNNMTLTNETCTAGNGSITGIVINGGTAPITYDWNSGAYTTLDITNLPAGNYTLTVTDNNGCTATTGPHAIIDEAGPTIDDTNVVIVGETCGNVDGSITGILVAGGTGPLTYDWSGTPTAGPDYVNIGAGAYTLTVTDANGCTATSGPHVVPSIGGPTVDISNMVVTDETCTAGNGSITGIVVSGGVPPYGYDWNSGAYTTLDISSLSAGNYTLTVTDNNGCAVVVGPFAVNDQAGPTLDINNMTIVDETCTAANGSISGIVVNGGTAPITYDWNSGAYSTLDISSLPAGNYTLTVTDNNGCTASTGPHVVNDQPGPVIDDSNVAIVDEACNQVDGSITGITVTGGTAPLSYDWSGNATAGPDYTNIAAGSYTLTVTDANGCTATSGPHTVNMLAAPVIDINNMTIIDETCTAANGSISGIVVTGGTGAITYDWNSGAFSTLDISGLSAGNYTLTVTDSRGCTATAGPFALVDQPSPVIDITSIAIVDDVCSGSNGSITGILVVGGTAPISYDWNSGAYSTLDINNIPAGSYTLTVTDNNGCTATTGPHTVLDSPAPVIDSTNYVITDENCGQGDGSITGITVSGGTGPLVYSWNATVTAGTDLTNASSGVYVLTITDANGCTAVTGPYIVGSIGGPVIDDTNMVITDESCVGNDGSITGITVSGGTLPYTYDWNGSASPGTDLTGQAAGTYILTVTDASGCSAIAGPYTIGTVIPNPFVITVNADTGICAGDSILLTGTVSGGGGNVLLEWTDGGNLIVDTTITGGPNPTSFDVWYTPASSGVICLNASDPCGTVPDTVCFNLTVNPLPTVTITADTTSGCVPLTVTFYSSGTDYNTCIWDFGDGNGGTTDTFTHTYFSPGVYDVTHTVTSISGCVTTVTMPGMITVHDLPTADYTFNPMPATDDDPVVTFMDGSSPNTASWFWDFAGLGTSTDQNPVFDFGGAGNYNVMLVATTANGCTDTVIFTVIVEEMLDPVQVPNVFSPNGDGVNDLFQIQNLPPGNHTIQIFNRWGEILFRTEDYLNNWDGYTNSGVMVPEGTYYFVLELEGEDPIKGYLTLTR